MGQASEEDRERMSPRWIAPIVTWLAAISPPASPGGCSKRRVESLAIAEGWHRGPRVEPVDDPVQHGTRRGTICSPRPGPTRHVRRRRQTAENAKPRQERVRDADQPRRRRNRVRAARDVSGRRRTRCSTPWAWARASTSCAFTTENTTGVPQQVLPTLAVIVRDGRWRGRKHRHVQPGDARARRAGDRAAPADPASRARSAPRARSPASTTRARPRSS